LVIVGDGSLRDELRRVQAQLQLDDACTLVGHRADVADLHNAFDLFVQSSDDEGSPNVVLEAMALETPVVVTDAGGTRDLVANGIHGIVVPCRNVAALTAALERSVADRAGAMSMAAAARARVERELSFSSRMARVESVYEELLSPRQRQRAVA
jgi:glycosyltransferase involved in cell wall biosynthesis